MNHDLASLFGDLFVKTNWSVERQGSDKIKRATTIINEILATGGI